MEKWITRFVATMVVIGGLGLCWTFGMFTAVPVQQGRLLELSSVELQLMLGSALAALAVTWGACISSRCQSVRITPACLANCAFPSCCWHLWLCLSAHGGRWPLS